VIKNVLDILDAIDQYDMEQEQQETKVLTPEQAAAEARLNAMVDFLDEQQNNLGK
jgi:hypothetical protein